jgi:hypothetical protein
MSIGASRTRRPGGRSVPGRREPGKGRTRGLPSEVAIVWSLPGSGVDHPRIPLALHSADLSRPPRARMDVLHSRPRSSLSLHMELFSEILEYGILPVEFKWNASTRHAPNSRLRLDSSAGISKKFKSGLLTQRARDDIYIHHSDRPDSLPSRLASCGGPCLRGPLILRAASGSPPARLSPLARVLLVSPAQGPHHEPPIPLQLQPSPPHVERPGRRSTRPAAREPLHRHPHRRRRPGHHRHPGHRTGR